jgi:hypothetical protein
VLFVRCHQWVSEFALCGYQSAGPVEVTFSWALQTHRMSDEERHYAWVADGENDYRPGVVGRRTAYAIVAAVHIHDQHFSAHLVADIHASVAPGGKQRPAELCPDMIADLTGH